MIEIDLKTWKRREHFEFFGKMDLPFYNINTTVDVSEMRAISKKKSISLNSLLMYVTIRSLNKIENFRYRVRGNSVVLHGHLNPSFTHIKKGEDLFRLVTAEFSDDINEFDRIIKEEIEKTDTYFNLEKLRNRDDFVFLSALPWFSFTGTDHTINLNRNDGIPRITWGKIYKDQNIDVLPYNIQVNHMFVDGIHIGMFFEEMKKQIAELRKI